VTIEPDTNPDCDGPGPHDPGQVRRLRKTDDVRLSTIVCHNCYAAEIARRQQRNREVDPDITFDLPAWDDLQIMNEYRPPRTTWDIIGKPVARVLLAVAIGGVLLILCPGLLGCVVDCLLGFVEFALDSARG